MFMTNKKAIEETKEIVKVYAPQILKQLGLEENDGILDRISVSEEVSVTTPYGVCQTTIRQKGFMGVHGQEYVEGTARITLYPLMFFHYPNKKGELKKLPFPVRFMKNKLRKAIIFTLAHELRHYWQYTTGEYFEHELQLGGISLMPYQHRWCERDANEFGSKFVKAL
jgi:hypothetical protein